MSLSKPPGKLIEGVESQRFTQWQPPGIITSQAEEVALAKAAAAAKKEAEAAAAVAAEEAEKQRRELEEIAHLEAIAALQPPTAEEIEAIQSSARQEGFELGRQEGKEAGSADIAAAVADIAAVVQALERPLSGVDSEVADFVVKLAMMLARQIIRRELHSDPKQLIAIVREAMKAIPMDSGRVTIHLNPEDAALVGSHLRSSGEELTIKIVDDPTITRGGAEIRSRNSFVDATIESQLETLTVALLGDERKEVRGGSVEKPENVAPPPENEAELGEVELADAEPSDVNLTERGASDEPAA
ncbi:MAG: hypothetical protein HQL49_12900 [Gammaproteobacteria bacterium]|nr:hypothetical protein [Gammaproteobacteria bacterium]